MQQKYIQYWNGYIDHVQSIWPFIIWYEKGWSSVHLQDLYMYNTMSFKHVLIVDQIYMKVRTCITFLSKKPCGTQKKNSIRTIKCNLKNKSEISNHFCTLGNFVVSEYIASFWRLTYNQRAKKSKPLVNSFISTIYWYQLFVQCPQNCKQKHLKHTE